MFSPLSIPTEGEEIETLSLRNLNIIDEDINFSNIFCTKNEISQGSHCIVYRLGNEQRVFRKAIAHMLENFDGSVNNFLLKEQILLESLDHPNIIKPIGICCHKGEYYQILPYYTPICDWILKNQLTKNHILKWTWQLFSVINYLHENLIIHRDIRTCNLLLNEEENIILIDFNCAQRVINTNPNERLGDLYTFFDYVDAYEWAPELRNHKLTLDFNSDLYMSILSILLLLQNSLVEINENIDYSQRTQFIVESFDYFTFDGYSFEEAFPELLELFERGFHSDPQQRISSKQAFLEMNQIITNQNKKSAKK